MAPLSTQLAVLAQLDAPRSTSEVAQSLGIEEVDVEEAVSSLEERGLVEREGFGAKTKLVPIAPRLPRLASQARAGLPADAWQTLFTGERAELAHVLHAVGSLELVACVLDEPVEHVRGEVHDLVQAGVIASQPLAIASSLPALEELLAEIDAQRARRWVRRRAPDARVRWHLGPEILFTSTGPVNDPDVTYAGPSLFEDHGVSLDVEAEVHCRTRRSLDASDAILQTLLTHPASEAAWDACLQLFSEQPAPTFREKARIYGLEDEAEEIRRAAGDG